MTDVPKLAIRPSAHTRDRLVGNDHGDAISDDPDRGGGGATIAVPVAGIVNRGGSVQDRSVRSRFRMDQLPDRRPVHRDAGPAGREISLTSDAMGTP